jgi:phosphoribosylformimino-5-aminoimidazole carboxamide ribotide isomerase
MARFELIPAIDLLEGRCVRLAQGEYAAATVYDDDPVGVAARFARHGIARLHVVDLDGARTGTSHHAGVVQSIVAAARGVPVQLGGGLRSLAAVDRALALGIDRVVLGTAALRNPDLVRDAARLHPDRVAVGVDAREGRVAVEGWLESSDAHAQDVARAFEDAGVAAIVYTDIARDGMLSGPDLEETARLAESVSIPVIASGGVSCEEDVRRAVALKECGVAGLIVGRALYTGAVQLERALRIAACS